MSIQQLSLWDGLVAKEETSVIALPEDDPIEPKEVYQRRRIYCPDCSPIVRREQQRLAEKRFHVRQ